MKNYKICSRCVMDTSDPDISFDQNQFCNNCTNCIEESKSIRPKGKERIEKLRTTIEKIKKSSKGKKYDCLIGMSGGIDSSYLAYLVTELGLRPLALHMDNGWNSQEAVKNIKNVCTKLNIDYSSHVLDWKEFKDIQLSFLKSSIVEVEIPTDTAIAGTLHRMAAKHNIKFIISGGNYASEGILPKKWFYDPNDKKLFQSIQKIFGKEKIKKFPFFDYKREIYYKFFKRIKMIYLLNLYDYDKEDAKKILEEKLNYTAPTGKHHESVYTRFMQSYIQPVKFNLDYRRATYSSLICSGFMKREEALKLLKNLPYKDDQVEKDITYVSKKFGITENDFKAIINKPAKSYKDYPNNERFLTIIYNIYRAIFN
ncbi:N-acetyl sugar amidotransferase [Alphaproteobacteria bacterium]|nr:N-acetyl sugar amidotransferase [Alphaproteobacteria bacterium]